MLLKMCCARLLLSGLTVELTRRRDFFQPSPDQSSYETRSRRSRPTICYGAMPEDVRPPPSFNSLPDEPSNSLLLSYWDGRRFEDQSTSNERETFSRLYRQGSGTS